MMRAPFQEGDFPGPVKYGYLSVGVVEEGPPDLVGRTVFCLHPHQTAYVVPVESVVVVPDDVPARAGRARRHGRDGRQRALGRAPPSSATGWPSWGRAWSGCCVARLLAGIPGSRVTLVDVDPARAAVAARARRRLRPARRPRARRGPRPRRPHERDRRRPPALARPARAGGRRCSTSAGTATRGSSCRSVGRSTPHVCAIRASQVGSVAAARRSRYTHAQRLALAVDLLRDPAFDALLTGDSPFEELPDVMPRLADGPCRPSATPSPTDPPTEAGSRCSA